jgi:hypothetical protein
MIDRQGSGSAGRFPVRRDSRRAIPEASV